MLLPVVPAKLSSRVGDFCSLARDSVLKSVTITRCSTSARSLAAPAAAQCSSPHDTPTALLSALQPGATAVKLVRENLKGQKDTGHDWVDTRFGLPNI